MPLLWLSIAIMLGIVVASASLLSSSVWVALAAFGAGAAILEVHFLRSRHPLINHTLFRVPVGLIILCAALGGLRFQSVFPPPSLETVAWYAPAENITATGSVVSTPLRYAHATAFIVQTETLTFEEVSTPVKGYIRVVMPAGYDISYGSRMALEGKLEIIEREELARIPTQGTAAVSAKMAYPTLQRQRGAGGRPLRAFLYQLRTKLVTVIFSLVPFPESALLSGILVGVEDAIPDYLSEAYRITGTIHIIAISGFNICIVIYFINRFSRLIKNRLISLLSALGAIVIFAMLVGAQAPVVRAAIMGAIALPGKLVGRKPIGILTLAIAAAGMALHQPLILWTVSFQLSFLATLGLLIMADPLLNWCANALGRALPGIPAEKLSPFLALVIPTIAAQFAILPVLTALDQPISLITLVANFLILPLQPWILVTGLLALGSAIIWLPIGQLVGIFSWLPLYACNQIVMRLSIQPSAQVALPPAFQPVITLAVLLCLLFFSAYQMIGMEKSIQHQTTKKVK